MARAASKQPKPGKVSIIRSDDDKLGWRVTGDDGKPLKPRFGKVIAYGGRPDAVKFRISSAAIQRALKAMKDGNVDLTSDPKEKGHRQKLGYGKGIRPYGGVRRAMKAKGSAASRSGRDSAKELD